MTGHATPGPGRAAVRRAFLGDPGDPRWARPALWGVLALAAVLYTWALGRNGYANTYYSAAVLSGTQSWKAFFFGALDAGSFITVDKPPLALWVMVLTARVFGFGTWSMLLPQAVMGVAAVGVVHSAVRRALPGTAGHAAALPAALVMTLTPITVAINRDNNPDTLLVLLLVLAAWFCQEAIRTGRMRTLVVSAVLVGLAFNTKMLQAYLVLPALAPVYLAMAPGTVARRLGHLLAAGLALVVSSAWWMVIVDLWPASSRPYVGGSTDNSVWDLVIGYNGLGRIFGGGFGGGGMPGGVGEFPGGGMPGGAFGGGGLPGGGMPGGGFGGESGAGRLFNDIMAGQISWLLPFAVIALITGLVLAGRRSPRVTRTALLLWGGWLAVHYVVFSFSGGIFHPYYSTAMAPAVAALTGLGGVLLWQAYRRSRAWAWGLPAGIAVTGAWAFVVLRRTQDFVPWLAWAVAAMTAVAVLGLVLARFGRRVRRRIAVVALLAGIVGALAGPAAYALTPLGSPVSGPNPTAGPAGSGGFGGMRWPGGMPGGFPDGGIPQDPPVGMPGGGGQGRQTLPAWMMRGGPGGAVDQKMIEYLKRNRGGATWLVAVSNALAASPIILSTGLPVIAMGGFGGGDPAMTVDRLKELVSSGRLRHLMIDGGRGGPEHGSAEASTWVRANCAVVAPAEYGGAEGGPALYRCD
ncbi:ArnT family glycosyltransferase [Streptosporangium sp. NPDC000396]|uniref:ArnT family glycosyltransferase n=1 Tax=Streptosporangium sp. NPDC000396 TaxID=3366185 RepID=UPI00367F8FBF